jgi:hypothetical protein
MNTFSKLAKRHGRAIHPSWGEVSILSEWVSGDGRLLQRVQVSEADAIRYTSENRLAFLSKGGA